METRFYKGFYNGVWIIAVCNDVPDPKRQDVATQLEAAHAEARQPVNNPAIIPRLFRFSGVSGGCAQKSARFVGYREEWNKLLEIIGERGGVVVRNDTILEPFFRVGCEVPNGTDDIFKNLFGLTPWELHERCIDPTYPRTAEIAVPITT